MVEALEGYELAEIMDNMDEIQEKVYPDKSKPPEWCSNGVNKEIYPVVCSMAPQHATYTLGREANLS